MLREEPGKPPSLPVEVAAKLLPDWFFHPILANAGKPFSIIEMPNRRQNTELLVGFFLLLGLGLAGWMTFRFGEFSGPGKEGYEVTIAVRDASGLQPTAPVRLGGLEIGRVASEPRLSDDFTHVFIDLLIEEGSRIPVGSDFSVGTSGLMGNSFVRITPPSEPS
ncbi:MAG: MlaD family protein, partial [Verrucomicrobiota bacterium]